jgi:protein-S-isoprenylcysteine O-methyltransferase Ste14
MHQILQVSANYLWLVLGVLWLIGALTTKRAQRTQSPGSRVIQFIPVTAAFFLLFARDAGPHWWHSRFFPEGSLALEGLGLALTAGGIGFAIWARLWIGRNWSGLVTIKEHHELIQSGPYAMVRHPIYSGFLLAILGTAILHGEWLGLLSFPLAALGWTLKLRTEESFMTQQFGNTYLDYKSRVKALVPFVV